MFTWNGSFIYLLASKCELKVTVDLIWLSFQWIKLYDKSRSINPICFGFVRILVLGYKLLRRTTYYFKSCKIHWLIIYRVTWLEMLNYSDPSAICDILLDCPAQFVKRNEYDIKYAFGQLPRRGWCPMVPPYTAKTPLFFFFLGAGV